MEFVEQYVRIVGRVEITTPSGERTMWERTAIVLRSMQSHETTWMRQVIIQNTDRNNLIFGCTIGALTIRSYPDKNFDIIRLDDEFERVR